jgi:hypothetical protein
MKMLRNKSNNRKKNIELSAAIGVCLTADTSPKAIRAIHDVD